jgi:hypothetical protein
MAITLFVAILPQISIGQIPTLDKLNLDSCQSPQCLDFNQDRICDFIVLTNETMVENPSLQSTQLEPISTPSHSATTKQPIKVTGEGNVIDEISHSEGYFHVRLNFGGAPSNGVLTVTYPEEQTFWVTMYRPAGAPEGHDIAASNGLLTVPFEKGTSSVPTVLTCYIVFLLFCPYIYAQNRKIFSI